MTGILCIRYPLSSALHTAEVLTELETEYLVQELLPSSSLPSIPDYTGKNEYFRLPNRLKIDKNDAKKLGIVTNFLHFRPEKSNLILVRQNYDPKEGLFDPVDPDFRCLCGKILNPDDNYCVCVTCPTGYHLECVENLCPKCNSRVKIRKNDVLVIESPVKTVNSPQILTSLQSMRLSVANQIRKSLEMHENSPENSVLTAELMENALYEASNRMENSNFYTRQARMLCFNIKDNEELREMVKNGEISMEKLVVMSSGELGSREIRGKEEEKAGEKRRKLEEEEEQDPFDPNNH